MNVRVRIMKCFLWSKLLYRCEARTIRKDLKEN